MEIALGVLGWAPATFWSSTPHEFWSAWTGWRRVNVPETNTGKIGPDEAAELRAAVAAEKGKVYRPGKGRPASSAEIIRLVRDRPRK